MMVGFEIVPALAAGLLATIVMTAMMTMATASGMSKMPPMPLLMGSMMTGDATKAKALGSVIHFGVMGTLVFGSAYAAIFTAADSTSWITGVAIGIVHGVLVGLVAMPMLPMMHPRMDASSTTTSRTDQRDGPADEVRLTAPGLFGKNWGGMTPMGIVFGHAIYGLIVALVYGWAG